MPTYLQLAQDARRACRMSGTGPSAITGQNEEYTRLLRWVRKAWIDIERKHPNWQFLRATAACQTVQGQYSYTSSDFGLSDFGYWALDSENGDTWRSYQNPAFTIDIATSTITLADHLLANGATVKLATDGALPTGYTASTTYYVVNRTDDTMQLATTAGGSAITLSGTQSGTHTMTSNDTTDFVGFLTEQFMGVMDYDRWRNAYLLGSRRSTYQRPDVVTKGPANTLMVGPIPAAGYTLVGDYYKVPAEPTAQGDEPRFASQFHDIIVYRTMMMYAASESAPEVYDEGKNGYDELIRLMEAHYLPELRVA